MIISLSLFAESVCSNIYIYLFIFSSLFFFFSWWFTWKINVFPHNYDFSSYNICVRITIGQSLYRFFIPIFCVSSFCSIFSFGLTQDSYNKQQKCCTLNIFQIFCLWIVMPSTHTLFILFYFFRLFYCSKLYTFTVGKSKQTDSFVTNNSTSQKKYDSIVTSDKHSFWWNEINRSI